MNMASVLMHNEFGADESKDRQDTGAVLPVWKRGSGLATESLVTLRDPVQENANYRQSDSQMRIYPLSWSRFL